MSSIAPALIKHFVHLYVHMDNGAVYDLQLGALREVYQGGTFVTHDAGLALGIVDLFNKNSVAAVRLVSKGLICAIEGPETARLKLDFVPDAEPLTLAANYGAKVTITPCGPDAERVNGLRFDVTPPPPLEEGAVGA